MEGKHCDLMCKRRSCEYPRNTRSGDCPNLLSLAIKRYVAPLSAFLRRSVANNLLHVIKERSSTVVAYDLTTR
jgi:hypothetical protein